MGALGYNKKNKKQSENTLNGIEFKLKKKESKEVKEKSEENKKENKVEKNETEKEKKREEKIKIETLKITLNENLPNPKKWNDDKICSFGYNKVFLGYLNAFFDHCPIKVSPNVIWQLILNKFSKYVNDNSEDLRENFVNFKGKKDLSCIRIGSFKDAYKYEEDVIEEFCSKISEDIGTELTEVLTPNFSTSTKETIIAGKVSIMSTFKKYFNYHFGMCTCGIPYIILEGKLEDWEKILEKLKTLNKCGFYISDMKEDILKIIDTKKGKIDLDFWRKIIMETKETVRETKKCMSYHVEKNVISGWILDFYSQEGIIEKQNDHYKLNDEVIKAPITLEDLNTGEKKMGIVYAGVRDLKQDLVSYIVEPIVNYCLSFNKHFSHEIEFEE